MNVPCFTYEERMATSGIRRRWFDVPHNSLPPIFYLPLYEKLSIELSEITSETVKIRVARYERVPKGCYPDRENNLDVYEYKGDEFR